jgi:hypothetical protein
MFVLAMTQIALQIATVTLALESVYSAVHILNETYATRWDSLQRMSILLGFAEDILLVTNTSVVQFYNQPYIY